MNMMKHGHFYIYDILNLDVFISAFEGGLARGPREMARLAMITGQFLSVMSCFSDAERMLLTAHDKLGNVSPLCQCVTSHSVMIKKCFASENIIF